MNIQGSLHDVGVPGVIDLALQMETPVLIRLQLAGQPEARLYLDDHRVVHVEFGPTQGMDALARLFTLEEGQFSLHPGEKPPQTTITADWNTVLLDVLHHLDEMAASPQPPADPPAEDTPLQAILAAADLEGAAVVGRDGLPLAIHLPVRDLDEDLLGAIAASIFALSDRSVQQLKRGQFQQTLIQGKDGNLIVTRIGQDLILISVVAADTSLGMAFAETRRLAKNVAEEINKL